MQADRAQRQADLQAAKSSAHVKVARARSQQFKQALQALHSTLPVRAAGRADGRPGRSQALQALKQSFHK